MITKIKRWIFKLNNNKELSRLAKNEFMKVYKDEELLSWSGDPVKISEGKYIVTLFYGDTKPPSRSWWMIDKANNIVEEFSQEKASKFIDIPVVR